MSNIHELAFNAEEIDELLDSVDKKTIYQDATQSEHGLMSVTDKTKLDALPTAQQIDGALNAKVDKVEGKGLSENDYTDAEKASVASAYHKPQNGIPKTDLDASVKTSLDKAETALQSETDPTVPSWAKQPNKPSYDYSEIGNTPDLSGFVTKSVNDLTNYYLKSETYSQTEINALIGAIQQFHYEIYATLPQTGQGNVLYLIGPTGSGADKYEEYVYANNAFTKIGDTSIDLSGYVTTSALNTALADYTTTANLTTLLASKADKVSNATNGDFAGLDANGNITDSGSKSTDFATASQGAKADTAYQKPQTGIPESDLSADVQSQLNKHFKGWYDSASNLPADPVVGDYAYVKGATASDPAAIYECTTAGTWSDSGMTADTSNVQTFATGEEVNETPIDNTNLVNPADGALPTAADVLQLKAKLDGATMTETKVINPTIYEQGVNGQDGVIYNTNPPSYSHVKISVIGYRKVRFAAQTKSSGSTMGCMFYDANDQLVEGSNHVFPVRQGDSNSVIELIVDVPASAAYFLTTVGTSTLASADFYCYLGAGKNVSDLINEAITQRHYEKIDMIACRFSRNTGNMVGAIDTANTFFKSYGYPLFLDLNKVEKNSIILQSVAGASVIYFCFDGDFAFLGYADAIIEGTRYVRFEYDFSQDQEEKCLKVDISFDASSSGYWIKDGYKNGEIPASHVQWLTIEVDTPNGDYATTDDYSSGQTQRDFTNGCIRYSIDYSNKGNPTPLVILFHGTSGYPFNKSSYSEEDEARYSFLAKCGYNVVDVSSVTYRLWYASNPSEPSSRIHGANFCYPTSEKNYIAIFNYVCKYFNVDRNRVYGIAKSAGGMLSTLFSTRLNVEIPLKATAQIAPGICTTINMLEITAPLNNFYLSQIGCQNPNVTGGLSGGNYDGRPAIPADKAYVLANLDKICRYDPFLTNTIGLDYNAFITQVLDTGNDNANLSNNETIAELIEASVKTYSCPIKIWHSQDDDRVPYIQSQWVVGMGARAGQECFLRTFPDGHGGHYIDNFLPSENNPSPTLTDYVNKFGVELENASVVYCEIVDWFNRWQ